MSNKIKINPFKFTADDWIEVIPDDKLAEIVNSLSRNVLDIERLNGAINNRKRVIEMRKDPGHEAWMELR